MRVWAKILNGEKIVRDIVYECDYTTSKKDFIHMVQEIAEKLDFFTPVILDTHIQRFERFNRVKFLARDFIDVEGITAFVLENITEEKKKPSGYLI